MSTDSHDTPEQEQERKQERAKETVVALFTQLCGNPDDVAVAAAADGALLALDGLLAAPGR